ncbi:MAG: YfhO family protein, partial [Limisphaerales bacterium]
PTAQPWVTINPSARIEDLQFENQHITFKTHSSRSVAAMIAQFHYHPWKATIDGEAVEITPTDLGFQSISVPAGEHVVELRYVDSRFRLGLLLAFITLAGGCWYYLRTKPDEDASKS